MLESPPLLGLKVLELAGVLAGPAAGMFLAELGAEVIKIENPSTGGDVTRGWRLPKEPADTDVTAYFCAANWGKRSLAVDLRTPEGLALVRRIAHESDVVLASYRPGQAEELGVDAATLRARNERLIYADVTAYGGEDDRPGYDALLQAGSGFMSINGEIGSRPLKMPVALMDLLAAHQLKEGILVALLLRERTGRGRHLSTSLVRSGLASLANQGTGWLATGEVPAPLGSGHPSIVPYGEVWECAGREPIVLAVGTDRQFRRLCVVAGEPELATDSRFAKNADRVVHRDALRAELAPRLARLSRTDLLAALQREAVPAGPVLNVGEALSGSDAEPLLLRSGERVGLRTVALDEGVPAVSVLRPPPHLSEDAREILEQDLALSPAECEDLFNRGIVLAPSAHDA